jgi:hypothetical protein
METEEDRRKGAFTGELLDRLDLEMAIETAGTKTFERPCTSWCRGATDLTWMRSFLERFGSDILASAISTTGSFCTRMG